MVTILMRCERSGAWPTAIRLIVFALLLKRDGGFRPIGLIPWLPRICVKAKRDIATQWERANDRRYLYAGPTNGVDVASWKQAARAEHAVSFYFDRNPNMLRHHGSGFAAS